MCGYAYGLSEVGVAEGRICDAMPQPTAAARPAIPREARVAVGKSFRIDQSDMERRRFGGIERWSVVKPIVLRFFSAIAVILLLAAVPVQTAHASGASAVIDRLHASLLEVMKNADSLGFAGRYKQLYPAIEAAFDHPTMVKSMVSITRWRKFSGEQQTRLLEAFRNFSVAEYANRFDGWSGESLKVVDEIKGRRGAVVVSTIIGRGDKDDVNLRYVMHKNKSGKWRIIDVLYLGTTSEVARRRAEYQSVIRREGVDALVKTLNRKVEQLASSEQARVAQNPR